jgi:hypothetical protein
MGTALPGSFGLSNLTIRGPLLHRHQAGGRKTPRRWTTPDLFGVQPVEDLLPPGLNFFENDRDLG